jgi:hypothetical protein
MAMCCSEKFKSILEKLSENSLETRDESEVQTFRDYDAI